MNSFLIIGGYGTVGTEAAKLVRQFQPGLPLALAGRDANKAQAAAAAIGNAAGVAVDTRRPDLGLSPDLQISGIAVLTNDLSTHPAKYAVRHGIPYTSIATQLTKLAPKLAVQVDGCARAASLMQDTNFAGVLVLVALSLMQRFSRIDRIEIGAVMDDQDLGGPNSQSDVDDFADKAPGFLLEAGAWVQPDAEQGSRRFTLLDGTSYLGGSFPSFDVPELAAASEAPAIRLDFVLDQTPGRRDTGQPSVEIVYEIAGQLSDGEGTRLKAQLSHPLGQTVLTGIGVAVAIESLLGLAGGAAPAPGLYLPSTLIEPAHMIQRLQEAGAQLRVQIDN
ncbi:hypothetical protein [Kerstersia gyiorum]|uniref:Saccharopine dehydrogenase n=1 Tax=Kerstersia gyiorum TaxID=206506 RepID=A0A171KSY7_9BURK|nr:hypothetical protein [Kerstersia gyiorum]KKO72004.1 hypothetical protein AAV32_08630 [Kerstersia gyiorum]MCR4158393.1 hypothetical protein [Kerstersia gyiorum]